MAQNKPLIVRKSLSGPYGYAHAVGSPFVQEDCPKDVLHDMKTKGYLSTESEAEEKARKEKEAEEKAKADKAK